MIECTNRTCFPYSLFYFSFSIDEMGLGKTLQSISMLAYMYEFQNVQGPHLIVVPKSTLSNWMNELKRWCPSLRAIRFHGMREDREALVAEYFTNEAAAHDGKRPTKPQIRNPETGEMEDDNSDNPRAWDVCVTTVSRAIIESSFVCFWYCCLFVSPFCTFLV